MAIIYRLTAATRSPSGHPVRVASWLVLAWFALTPLYVGASERILSLDLCTDWMLAHYADRGKVLALSPYSRRQPPAWMDQNWPSHDGSLEHIVALRPDLVITGEYNARQLRTRLKSIGIPVEILALPTDLHAVARYERQFLSLLDKPARLPPAPAPQPISALRKRLLLLGANGIGTGRNTFESDILEHAGWANYLPAAGYQQLDLERLVIDPPDAILWTTPTHAALANRFGEHQALRRALSNGHWLQSDYWRWQCPGPWTWELVRQLQQWRE